MDRFEDKAREDTLEWIKECYSRVQSDEWQEGLEDIKRDNDKWEQTVWFQEFVDRIGANDRDINRIREALEAGDAAELGAICLRAYRREQQ